MDNDTISAKGIFLLVWVVWQQCRNLSYWRFYTPLSGSRSEAVWGRAVCLSGLRPSSPPSCIQHRHPGSPHLSSGSWWRTALLLTSSPPTLPAINGDVTGQRSLTGNCRSAFSKRDCAVTFGVWSWRSPCQSYPSPARPGSWSHWVRLGPCYLRAGWTAGGLMVWSLSYRGPALLSVVKIYTQTYIKNWITIQKYFILDCLRCGFYYEIVFFLCYNIHQ